MPSMHKLFAGKPGGIPNSYASGPMPQGGAMNNFVPQQQPASKFLHTLMSNSRLVYTSCTLVDCIHVSHVTYLARILSSSCRNRSRSSPGLADLNQGDLNH